MNNIDTFTGSTTLKPYIDIDKGIIEFDCIDRMNDIIISHHKDVMNTKDEIIRKGLIAMGWTPPKEEKDEVEM